MKTVYTDPALDDLEEIRAYLVIHYPAVAPAVRYRIEEVVRRIALYPESVPRVEDRPDVRAASLIRYPYKIFYRIEKKTIYILHIHHSARSE